MSIYRSMGEAWRGWKAEAAAECARTAGRRAVRQEVEKTLEGLAENGFPPEAAQRALDLLQRMRKDQEEAIAKYEAYGPAALLTGVMGVLLLLSAVWS